MEILDEKSRTKIIEKILIVAEKCASVSNYLIDVSIEDHYWLNMFKLTLTVRVEDVRWYHLLPVIGGNFPVNKKGNTRIMFGTYEMANTFNYYSHFYTYKITHMVDLLIDWLNEMEKYNKLGLFERMKAKKTR